MARRHPILRAFTILAVVTLAALALVAGVAVFGGGLGERPLFGNVVGVVELRGVIEDATDLVEALERFRTSDATVAVVLRIDSPGGAVAPSQEIYDEVQRVREGGKPIFASLGNVAASGGYYVASAANKILADPGTITGSIGAIMTVPYYAPLADKIGFAEETVTSGRCFRGWWTTCWGSSSTPWRAAAGCLPHACARWRTGGSTPGPRPSPRV